jgi:hypothetical protein
MSHVGNEPHHTASQIHGKSGHPCDDGADFRIAFLPQVAPGADALCHGLYRSQQQKWPDCAAQQNVIAAPVSRSFLQCIPYAREVSGIQLTATPIRRWEQAAGRYQRGFSPRRWQ